MAPVPNGFHSVFPPILPRAATAAAAEFCSCTVVQCCTVGTASLISFKFLELPRESSKRAVESYLPEFRICTPGLSANVY